MSVSSGTTPAAGGLPPQHWTLGDTASAAAFLVYAASVVVLPIAFIALVAEFGTTLTQGGLAEGVRAFLLVLTLVVSGLVAARIGIRLALAVGALVLAAGLAAYAAAPSWSAIVAAMILVGCGGGLIEALVNPLVQQMHPASAGRYLNIVNAFFSLGVVTTVLVSGELLTRAVSWRAIAWALAGIASLVGVAFFALSRRERARPRQQMRGVVRDALIVLRRRRFWLFGAMIALGGGAEGGLTFWSASYVQLHYGALPRLGGAATAAFAAGMFVGRLSAGWLIPQRRLWHLILGSAVVGATVTTAAAAASGIMAFLLALFAAGLSIASFWPSIQSYAVDRLQLDSLSTFILLSCLGIPGFGGTAWLMGWIGDRAGLERSLLVVPLWLVVLAALAVVERTRRPAPGDQASTTSR